MSRKLGLDSNLTGDCRAYVESTVAKQTTKRNTVNIRSLREDPVENVENKEINSLLNKEE